MTRRQRVCGGLATWVLTFGVVRLVIAQPEQCGTVSVERLDHAIDEAVGWASRTQGPDGRFIYRYNARTDTDRGFYEFVRHAGLTMALYQAAGAGVDGARAIAEKADAYARAHLVAAGGGHALAPVVDDGQYDIGATALFLNALLYRRALGDVADDDMLLVDLGRFLVANVAPSGAVAAYWDARAAAPITSTSSPFYTGEALWAIARLERLFPGEWRDPALRIAHYLATTRDDAESRWPDVPDHWAAYALAEMSRWPAPSVVDDTLVAYARHIGALESMQIRYESQRTGTWFSRATRGQTGLGAGVGALAEALMSLRSVPALAGDQTLRRRAECAAGVLLHRQTSPAASARYPNPERARGAWIRDGTTQIDDQQHALSALLLLRDLEATS